MVFLIFVVDFLDLVLTLDSSKCNLYGLREMTTAFELVPVSFFFYPIFLVVGLALAAVKSHVKHF
jgi:hypothetical protein